MKLLSVVLKQLRADVSYHDVSFLVISTTNPVYLIFKKRTLSPIFAIRLSTSPKIFEQHKANIYLHKIVGDLVVRPITCFEIEGKFVSVQEGAGGRPWFSSRELFRDCQAWESFFIRSIECLDQFSDSIRHSERAESVNLASGFGSALSEVGNIRESFSSSVERLIAYSRSRLESLKSICGFSQHGDFCINNMLVNRDSIKIIDFEDFGKWQMPLYDACSLGVSLYENRPSFACEQSIWSFIKLSTTHIAKVQRFDNGTVIALFVYFLISRLGKWSDLPKRRLYKAKLTNLLEDFASEMDEEDLVSAN